MVMYSLGRAESILWQKTLTFLPARNKSYSPSEEAPVLVFTSRQLSYPPRKMRHEAKVVRSQSDNSQIILAHFLDRLGFFLRKFLHCRLRTFLPEAFTQWILRR